MAIPADRLKGASPEPLHDRCADPVRVFVTVGTELPFDRLVGAVDEWAERHRCGQQVFAQIGRSGTEPRHIRWKRMVHGDEYTNLFLHADLIVAHAGMGTIIGALESQRPLVVMPRRADLGEHRNDHQLATVRRLVEIGLIQAVDDVDALVTHLDRFELGATGPTTPPISRFAGAPLIETIRTAVRSGQR